MSRRVRLGLLFSAIVITLGILGGIIMNQSQQNKNSLKLLPLDSSTIHVQPEDGYDGFEGWGTSLAWWGHVLGQWTDKEKLNEVMDLVFDPDKGLGLNIVRYNIGGGENPSIENNSLRPGGDVPGFQPTEGQWDWDADEGQRTVLLAALQRGATIAEAFSNSPPYWMTNSGSVTGAVDGGNNLKDEYYDVFADYLTEVVKQYKEKWGVTFRTLNPLNEPASNWWKKGNIQEGSHFSVDKQMEIIKKVSQSLQSKGLSDTAISGPDENSVDETLEMLHGYDETTIDSISQINTHTYNGIKLEELRDLAKKNGQRLWMSEYGTGGSEPHNHQDITSVMELAERIIYDLHILQPAAWIYWQAIEDESANNNWGFIHSDFLGEETYELTKQYYAMANFSRFIHPGSRIIRTDDGRSVAAYDAQREQLTIVVRNEQEEKEVTYDLTSFEFDSTIAEVYLTSDTENLNKSELPLFGNGFKLTVEEQSVTTIVISSIRIKE
ncbi:glycoside hydrolase family 30 protein [Paenibacillus sp. FA6]|uniref:glycoside hydrolase family 30 protein n=1 Tax=Paenibacillus sp. FA6 TaxID=3413029 RepID=UPI003F65BBF4